MILNNTSLVKHAELKNLVMKLLGSTPIILKVKNVTSTKFQLIMNNFKIRRLSHFVLPKIKKIEFQYNKIWNILLKFKLFNFNRFWH